MIMLMSSTLPVNVFRYCERTDIRRYGMIRSFLIQSAAIADRLLTTLRSPVVIDATEEPVGGGNVMAKV